jgi:hypothetical protein
MLHAASRAGFAAKALLRSLISDESLAENFQRDGPIDEQVRGAINRAHASTAQNFIQAILAFEGAANQRVDGNVSNRGVSLQGIVIVGTHEHIVGKLPAASWALKHIDLRGELWNIMA